MKERNQPIFFRKLPKSEDTEPNAVYKRSLGNLPKQGPVCEIEWRDTLWTVRESEALSASEALSEQAKKYQDQIEQARRMASTQNGANNANPSLELVAKAFGKSVGTLRKRMKFVQNFLPKQ